MGHHSLKVVFKEECVSFTKEWLLEKDDSSDQKHYFMKNDITIKILLWEIDDYAYYMRCANVIWKWNDATISKYV